MTRLPIRRTPLVASLALLLAAATAHAGSWPHHEPRSLSEIGRGAAVIFTPDLAVAGNRTFYENLGFLYIEESDWRVALARIATHNLEHPGRRIEAVILETHGTNGHGLKLQTAKDPRAPRSYISVGALTESLDRSLVDRAYVSACNAGRLFRPGISRALNPNPGDPLFLPPTLGVIDASSNFDPSTARAKLLRRTSSHLESLLHGSTAELRAPVRAALAPADRELPFAISTMLIQLLTADPSLELTAEGWVETRSRADLPPAVAEALFQRFITWTEAIAGSERLMIAGEESTTSSPAAGSK